MKKFAQKVSRSVRGNLEKQTEASAFDSDQQDRLPPKKSRIRRQLSHLLLSNSGKTKTTDTDHTAGQTPSLAKQDHGPAMSYNSEGTGFAHRRVVGDTDAEPAMLDWYLDYCPRNNELRSTVLTPALSNHIVNTLSRHHLELSAMGFYNDTRTSPPEPLLWINTRGGSQQNIRDCEINLSVFMSELYEIRVVVSPNEVGRCALHVGASIAPAGALWSSGSAGGVATLKGNLAWDGDYVVSCHHVVRPTKGEMTVDIPTFDPFENPANNVLYDQTLATLMSTAVDPALQVRKSFHSAFKATAFGKQAPIHAISDMDQLELVRETLSRIDDAENHIKETRNEQEKHYNPRHLQSIIDIWNKAVAINQKSLAEMVLRTSPAKRLLGNLSISSGYGIGSEKNNLDFALIKKDGACEFENTLPSASYLLRNTTILGLPSKRPIPAKFMFLAHGDFKLTGTAEPQDGEEVVMHGRKSGYVFGKVVGKATTRYTEHAKEGGTDVLTEDWSLQTQGDHQFGQKGDSGSWVINTRGEVVGIFFGASEKERKGYMISWSQFCKWVFRETGCTVTVT